LNDKSTISQLMRLSTGKLPQRVETAQREGKKATGFSGRFFLAAAHYRHIAWWTARLP
jgi:hypothetical protein